ncbi:MAG: 16S rRNA (cytosine(1402)-N(4))-methyltransferase RsmH [Oceanococcus sp.]
MTSHESVLLDASLAALNVKEGGVYIDATFGRGGHSRAILDRLGEAGRLIVFDQDPEAQAVARGWMQHEPRLLLEEANFSDLAECISARGLNGQIDGVLFDLGVSSPQLDDAERGFSFSKEGPLDMRMNPLQGMSAADWVAHTPREEIRRVLREYGDEAMPGRIASAIERARAEAPILNTLQLADLIETAVGGRRGKRIHPATRSFQAIRIAVNRELEVLAQALPQALEVLRPGGRLSVISFHSLEDRIVKQFLRAEARPSAPDPISPAPAPRVRQVKRQLCDGLEAQRNPRARSAVLRWAEKCA